MPEREGNFSRDSSLSYHERAKHLYIELCVKLYKGQPYSNKFNLQFPINFKFQEKI
jgi:hypothetical protein